MKIPEIYRNSRLFTLLVMGFSSGLPLALTGNTLQAWYTVAGVDIVTIGFLALVGQPYIFKFVWAPLMDRYIPPFLGRRRGWILITQLTLAIAIALMALFNPLQSPVFLGSLALLVAFLSASQDIALDAYRTDLLSPSERGLGAAVGVGGYRIAMLISGGAALVLADMIGWQWTYFTMAALMIIGILASWFGPEATYDVEPPQNLATAIIEPFREFMTRKNATALLVLIILYKLGEAFTSTHGPLTTAFLLRGIEFSLTTVGTVNKGIGLLATIVGVFVGGAIMTRISLYKALFGFGVLQAVANLSFLLLAIVGKNYVVLIGAVFLDNLCVGMGTAAIVALIMALCDHRYSATQFALLSSVAAMSRIFVGPIGAIMVEHIGWVQFFVWSFIVALPALFLLWLLQAEIHKADNIARSLGTSA